MSLFIRYCFFLSALALGLVGSGCSSQKAQELANSAVDAVAKHKYEQASTLLKEAISVEPTNSEFYFMLGTVYKNQGRQKEAAMAFEQAAKQKPSATAYYEAALASISQNLTKEAEDFLKQAASLAGNKPDLYAKIKFHQGKIALSEKSFDKADAFFREAIKTDSNFHPPLLELANMYLSEGLFKEAAAVYELATLAVPEGDIFLRWGTALRRCQKYDEAIAAFNKANEAKNRSPFAYHFLAMTYESKGDLAKALDSYRLFGKEGLSPTLSEQNRFKIASLENSIKKKS